MITSVRLFEFVIVAALNKRIGQLHEKLSVQQSYLTLYSCIGAHFLHQNKGNAHLITMEAHCNLDCLLIIYCKSKIWKKTGVLRLTRLILPET